MPKAHICNNKLQNLVQTLPLLWQQPISVMGKTRPGSERKKHIYVQHIFLLALRFKLLFTAPLGHEEKLTAKKKNTNMVSLSDKAKKIGSATLRAERPAKSKTRLLRQNLGGLGRWPHSCI